MDWPALAAVAVMASAIFGIMFGFYKLISKNMSAEIRAATAEVKTSIAEVNGEVKTSIAEVNGEVKASIAEVDGEVKTSIAEVNGRIDTLTVEMRSSFKAMTAEMRASNAALHQRIDSLIQMWHTSAQTPPVTQPGLPTPTATPQPQTHTPTETASVQIEEQPAAGAKTELRSTKPSAADITPETPATGGRVATPAA